MGNLGSSSVPHFKKSQCAIDNWEVIVYDTKWLLKVFSKLPNDLFLEIVTPVRDHPRT